jgi:DNA invertase Pin-like site-specific DNA recombinase
VNQTASRGTRSWRPSALCWRLRRGDFGLEVESGKNSDRPALEKALAAARLHRASLVVSKVDRLTRSVAFLSRLLEAGVDVSFADLPQIEGATGRFLLQQMVAVEELEAGMISARTKAALQSAKRHGKKLGGNRGVKPTAKMRALSTAALQRRADARAADAGRAPSRRLRGAISAGGAQLRRYFLRLFFEELAFPNDHLRS